MNFQTQDTTFTPVPHDYTLNNSGTMGSTSQQDTISSSNVLNGIRTQPAENPRMARRLSYGGSNPFPVQLYILLESNEHEDIISWQPSGRSFFLHKPQDFVDSVMPLYFNQTMLRSFRRQLNLYEFQR